MSDRPKAVSDAVHTLERAEKVENHEERAKLVKASFDSLKRFLVEHPDSEHREYVENVKRAYLRSHMIRLSSVREPDTNTWFFNFILFGTSEREVAEVLQEQPELAVWHGQFVESQQVWAREVLVPMLERSWKK
jgi:hypothetical protein